MLNTKEKKDPQNFFFLGCIQIAAIGIPAIALGSFLSNTYGPGTAICSIFIGNLILWLIGVSIISMSDQGRINSIQNIKNHLGNLGALFSAIILFICVMNWFTIQTNSSILSIQKMINPEIILNEKTVITIGVLLGLFSTLLSLKGIRMLKWISLITFPILIIYCVYSIVTSKVSIPPLSFGLSFSAILITTLSFLTGILNLPTFFRHSISRGDSYLALTFFTLFFTLLESTSIWINFSDAFFGILGNNPLTNPLINIPLTLLFILLASVCNNLLNIYFASFFYEAITQRLSGATSYALVGLSATILYLFSQLSSSTFTLDIFNCYILNLVLTLLVAFLIRVVVKHRLRPFEKWINLIGWAVGCVAGTLSKLQHPQEETQFLLVGLGYSALFFLIVFFIEETIWAFRQLLLQKTKNR